MRKRMLAVVVCVALMITGIAATLAYFMDSDKAVNTFTVGKVEISLFEDKVENGQITEITDKGFKYHLVPGETYSKRPHVRVEAGSDPCWIFVTVDNQIQAIEGGDTKIEEQMKMRSWTKLDGVQIDGEDVYAYSDIVESGADTAKDVMVFEKFTIDGDKATNEQLKAHEDSTIVIKAYAIQAAGFDSAAEAWEAAHTQF